MAMEIAAGTTNGMTPGENRHLASLEKRIASGLQTFREVGSALLEIRDKRLYRETHSSFESYCSEKWGLDRGRAYQLMGAATVSVVLGRPEKLGNEAQARELVPLVTEDPDIAKKVWAEVETRSEESGKPVTASLIRKVKAEMRPGGESAPAQTPTERLVQDMVRLVNTYQRWNELKPRPNIGERQLVKAAVKRLIEAFST